MTEKKFHHTIASNGTYIGIRENEKLSHPTLEKIFEMLKARGWEIQIDQGVDSVIAKNYFKGKKGELCFKSHRYPAGFEIEFYQEIITVNLHGGYYDFDKLKNMPYLIRCRFLVEIKYISELLINEGYKDSSESWPKLAFDNVMYRIKKCTHYEVGKELPEYQVSGYNAKDKNGKRIRNGEVKYYRDRKGRLQRGTVYYNLNNMWWIILNKHSFTNVASFDLFDLNSEKDRIPKLYSREIPYRIRKEKARNQFNEAFDYTNLRNIHIEQLRLLVSHELALHDEEMDMSLKSPLKKDLVVLKTRGLKYASIKVDGPYFSDREGITFNQDGFIGFAGWASGSNLKPFVIAFEKWLDWLGEVVEIAA